MKPTTSSLVVLTALALLSTGASGQVSNVQGAQGRPASQPQLRPTESFSWRYYRPGNTGIQGVYCEALWVGPDGDPYIGGYNPLFEEGGFAKFIQNENRWVNYSNVDYPVIGHPNETGCTRVNDIVPDATGKLWMAVDRWDEKASLPRGVP